MAYELDEIIPVSRGGDPFSYDNVDAAHRSCNQRRGNKPLAVQRASAEADLMSMPLPLSQEW